MLKARTSCNCKTPSVCDIPEERLSGVDQSMVLRGCQKLGLRTLLTFKSVKKGPQRAYFGKF